MLKRQSRQSHLFDPLRDERFGEMIFRDKWIEVIADEIFGIKRLEERWGLSPYNYISARMSKSAAQMSIYSFLRGALQWNGFVAEKVQGTRGLGPIFHDAGKDLDRFLGWMIGLRAARLMSDGRENLFTEGQIDALISLGTGKESKFESLYREYVTYKTAMLDFAQNAEIIDADMRKAWENLEYIPIYRRLPNGTIRRPLNKQRLSHESHALNHPIENIFNNISHLIDASMKNKALLQTVDDVMKYQAAHEDVNPVIMPVPYSARPPDFYPRKIPRRCIRTMMWEMGVSQGEIDNLSKEDIKGFAKLWSVEPRAWEDIIMLKRKGKSEYYHVHDPYLFRALISVQQQANASADPKWRPGWWEAHWTYRLRRLSIYDAAIYLLSKWLRWKGTVTLK